MEALTSHKTGLFKEQTCCVREMSKMRMCAYRTCDSGVKPNAERETLCHYSRGSERVSTSQPGE